MIGAPSQRRAIGDQEQVRPNCRKFGRHNLPPTENRKARRELCYSVSKSQLGGGWLRCCASKKATALFKEGETHGCSVVQEFPKVLRCSPFGRGGVRFLIVVGSITVANRLQFRWGVLGPPRL